MFFHVFFSFLLSICFCFVSFFHLATTLSLSLSILSFYDSDGLGYLLEQDLENYVYDHIPTIPALQPLQQSFYTFYVFTAVRRFMFFLDPRRTGQR